MSKQRYCLPVLCCYQVSVLRLTLHCGIRAADYTTLAGLRRAPGSRSWRELVISPPAPGTLTNLSWANASIDTPMGVVGSSWRFETAVGGGHTFSLNATVPQNGRALVIMPTLVDAATATVLDLSSQKKGGSLVWNHGIFVHGSGFVKGSVHSDGRAVAFEVGGGDYVLTTGSSAHHERLQLPLTE